MLELEYTPTLPSFNKVLRNFTKRSSKVRRGEVSGSFLCWHQNSDSMSVLRKESRDPLQGLYGLRVDPLNNLHKIEVEEEPVQTTWNSWPPSQLKRMCEMVPSSSRPSRCCQQGDQSFAETAVNVLTSVPFVILGLKTPRRRLREMLYANSLIGVGVASSMYHISRGEARKILRWADYAMIAATSVMSLTVICSALSCKHEVITVDAVFIHNHRNGRGPITCYPVFRKLQTLKCLSTALRENPKAIMAASAVALPFQPFLVSAVHTGMMEITFAKRVALEPELRPYHSLHTVATALGGALFIADDLFPNTPYIHAAWHLAAAVGVGTCNKLLE